MKHLQKFPKTVGDTILLGTIVALGIKPDTGQFFVTFDCNGELQTYLIDNPRFASTFLTILRTNRLRNDSSFSDLTARKDLKLTREAARYKVYSLEDESIYTYVPDP